MSRSHAWLLLLLFLLLFLLLLLLLLFETLLQDTRLPRLEIRIGTIVKGKCVGSPAPSSILIAVEAVVDWDGVAPTYHPLRTEQRRMRGVCDAREYPEAATLRQHDAVYAAVIDLDLIGGP